MDRIIHKQESSIYLSYEGKGKNPFSDLIRGGVVVVGRWVVVVTPTAILKIKNSEKVFNFYCCTKK